MNIQRVSLVCLLVLAAHRQPLTSQAEARYWDLATFRELRSLAPELVSARLANLAPAGQRLWEDGGMRVPESVATSLIGDFTKSGALERATLFEVGEYGELTRYLLVARRQDGGWKRLLLMRLDQHGAGNLLWDVERGSLGLTTGSTRRATRSATISWPDGKGQSGYVIEEMEVLPFRWNRSRNRFERGERYWYRAPD